MSWTEERVSVLKKLWAEGHSASQIAKQLGGVTRNAVIGKVHRLGLSGRATPSRPVKRPPRLARPKPRVMPDGSVKQAAPAPTTETMEPRTAPERAPADIMAPLPPLQQADGEPASILTLRDSMCKWPIGDPADPKFAFCGRKADCGPYCAEHAKVAFQPARKRDTRKGEYDYVRRIAG
ncbi:GcrA family cell cycle regulator [Hyphomonas pacifica]|uniref:GcrA cell cycle regulator n=1 Tax=Hyphomonas pacifica TaxID=1280941 RepID=A0A062TW77_9PROT|nr:GcrA family cell cycle regulator [Hyphomonas pacifica]KCZ48327.1 GcrA cell cycle regulator [Hyphomonas pacifica]RAN31639.1 GcrA cell cycle regulator [Hyphomonas pacifica]RAN32030.1 GcrA cell cycle regulator [Hyphomonas pacifica]